MGFWKNQWNDIKGNAKWALLCLIGTAILWATPKVLTMIPYIHIPLWLAYALALILLFCLFVWLVRTMRVNQQVAGIQSATTATTLTTSAATFNPTQFMAQAYKSALTDEAQNNMRTAVTAQYPNQKDRESFYLRFIGVGIQAYLYDTIWWTVYRSQLLLLNELNQRVLTLDEGKVFFDNAAKQHPNEYAKDNYDRWLSFLKVFLLVLQDGTKIAVSDRGRDFLKYLVHCGRSETTKKF